MKSQGLTLKSIFVFTFLLKASLAWSMPVFDLSVWLKTIEEIDQLKSQYEILEHSYDAAKEQLKKTQQVTNALTGHSKLGALLDSDLDLSAREWTLGKWDDTLKGLAGHNPDRYQELLRQYQQKNQVTTPETYKQHMSARKANDYAHTLQLNQTATSQASYAFERIQHHFQNIHKLTQEIEHCDGSKCALDLNSRLIAELAYISTEELRMQTLLNHQVARQQADIISGEGQEADFIQNYYKEVE